MTDDHIPFFTSNQLPEYQNALLRAYGTSYQPERQEDLPAAPAAHGDRGRYPNLRHIPSCLCVARRQVPGLLYAQVLKKREKGQVVEVDSKVVFGHPGAIAASLADSPVSETINISFVERDNLSTCAEHGRQVTTSKQPPLDSSYQWLLQGDNLV